LYYQRLHFLQFFVTIKSIPTMKKFLLSVLLTGFFAIKLSPATAQIPRTFSYQGTMVDATLHPVDGPHDVTVNIYDVSSGGSAIYTENHPATMFIKGVFLTIVGSVTEIPPGIAFDKPYYLGFSVDGGAEMLPRTQIVSAPYSFMAGMADSLAPGANAVNSVNGQSGDITLLAGTGTLITKNGSEITINAIGTGGTGIQGIQNLDGSLSLANSGGPIATVSVANGGITTAKLADASVTSAKIDAKNITAGKVLSANGTGGADWQLPPAGGGGLNLPFSQSVVSAASPAFEVINTGAATIQTAGAGLFTVSNTTSAAFALWGSTNGTAASIGSYGSNIGLGRGGFFEITNAANNSTGLTGKTQGLGIAAEVLIASATNASSALNVKTIGIGKAGYFQIANTANASNVIEATTNGTGNGIVSTTIGGNAISGSMTSTTSNKNGVIGETSSPNGSGVKASYIGAGTGVPLILDNGPIKVTGTVKAAFKWVAAANTINGNLTAINNPLTNGDPNAIVFVTQLLDANTVFTNLACGVWYDAIIGKWTIFLENPAGVMPANAAFNVLVFKQ
jgi:hypothetical protein